MVCFTNLNIQHLKQFTLENSPGQCKKTSVFKNNKKKEQLCVGQKTLNRKTLYRVNNTFDLAREILLPVGYLLLKQLNFGFSKSVILVLLNSWSLDSREFWTFNAKKCSFNCGVQFIFFFYSLEFNQRVMVFFYFVSLFHAYELRHSHFHFTFSA